MSENSLKPCPLCGVIDAFVYTETIPLVGGDSYDVGVVDCVSGECPMIIRAPTEEEAIKKWNTRPREDALQADVELLRKEMVEDDKTIISLRTKLNAAVEALMFISNTTVARNGDRIDMLVDYACEALVKLERK